MRSLLSLIITFSVLNVFSQNTLSYTEIESHYNNGIELYEKKAFAAARKELQTYVLLSEKSLSPNNFNIANATYYATVSSLNAKAKDADIEVERFVIKYPDHPKAKLIFTDLAELYFEQKNYDDAIIYFEKTLANRNNNLNTYEIRYKLGLAYYLKKEEQKALEQFDIVKNTASISAKDASYYAGAINFKNNKLEAAYLDLKKVENVNPYKTEIPNWLGQILFKQKKYDELLEYATPIVSNPNGRKTDELSLLLAEVHYSNNNFEKAALYYDKYKNFKRNAPDQVNFRHAYAYYKINEFQKAANIFKLTANQNSELGQQSAYYLGISALKTNDINAAMLAFEEAKKLDFDKDIKEEAEYNLIKVLVEKNNNPKAISSLQSYLKNYPNGKYVDESNELLSQILSESSSYQTAITYIESLKRKTPKIEAAYQKLCYNQGIQDYNAEKLESAIAYFDKASKGNSDSEIALQSKFWKAECYQTLGRPEALSLYRELQNSSNTEIKLKSQYSYAYHYFNEKEYDNAKKYFSDFISSSKSINSLEANREDALLRLADCHLVSKEYTVALNLYDKAYLENKGDKDYALYQKGLTLKLLDKDSEAKEVFEKFTRVYPNSRLIDDALYQNGLLEMEKSNYNQAISIFSDLIKRRPNSTLVPAVLLKRALSFGNVQNHEKAILDYKLIINNFSKTPYAEEALLGLKESLNAVNRSEDFAESIDKYSKANPSSSSAKNLQFDAARDLYYAEKYDKAISAFQNFISSNPNDANVPEGKFLIAESFNILGKKSDALPYYEELIKTNQVNYITKAALRTADIYFSQKSYADAARNYQEAANATNAQREVIVALEGLYKSYFFNKEYDRSIEACNKVIAEGGNIVINSLNRATLWKGKNQAAKADYTQAKNEFNKVLSLGTDESAAEAKYLIGEIQYKQKEYDASIKTLQELSNDYADFLVWYENAFLMIADNYIAKNDSFQATATLKSIIDNASNPEIVAKAKEKLKNIPK